MIGFVLPHRHNPQLLLTDQRSPEKKIADAYVEQYRQAFPSLKDFWKDNLGEIYQPKPYQSEIMDALTDPSVERVVVAKGGPRRWADGGMVTGRFSGGREPFPHFLSRSEAILPKDHPLVAVDFGKIEARAIAHYAIPKHIVIKVDTSSFVESLEKVRFGTEQFARRMREHTRALSKLNDRMILLALFGDINLDEPEPGFAYERRLAKLLKSRDRRQRKRGERLFNKWYRTRKGMNLYRGYSGK